MRHDLEAALQDDPEIAAALRTLTRARVPAGGVGLEAAAGAAGDLVAAAAADRGLEAIIMRHGRPSLLIFNGMFEPPMLQPWTERLAAAIPALSTAIAATGRVEVPGIGAPFLGTAWVIEDNIAVTNRHVAELFVRERNGVFDFAADANGQPFRVVVDFVAEADNLLSKEVLVTGVLFVASAAAGEADVAFLELDRATAPAPAPRGDDAPLMPQEMLATIGYPAWNSNNNASDMMRIFTGGFDVKRLAPGWVKQGEPITFTHDCSVLNGSSGSVVMSLTQGGAVGLHYWGQEGVENRAVRVTEVRRLLDRALGRTAASRNRAVGPGPHGGDLDDLEAAPPLDDRRGYVADDFLLEGVLVPLPKPIDDPATVLASVIDDANTFELKFHHYSSFMHRVRKLPMFTAVNIDGSRLVRVKRTTDRWFLDPRLPDEAQTGPELYRGNSLDQGHMVRRLDPAWGDGAEDAILDTFFYSNCAPQHMSLNRTTWLALEDYVLENAATHGFKLCVFTGPIFSDKDPLYRDTIKIPQAFWKVVVTLREDGAEPQLASSAYALSQADLVTNLEFAYGPFRTYQVPIERVQRWARLDFGAAVIAADAMARGEEAAPYLPIDSPSDMVL